MTGLIDGVQYRLGCATYVKYEDGFLIENKPPLDRTHLVKSHLDRSNNATEIFLANDKELLAVFFLE